MESGAHSPRCHWQAMRDCHRDSGDAMAAEALLEAWWRKQNKNKEETVVNAERVKKTKQNAITNEKKGFNLQETRRRPRCPLTR